MVNEIIKRTVQREGGYVNDPTDRGGETNWGITKRVAKNYGYNGDMKDLSLETAVEIYKTKYWEPMRLDDIESNGIKELMFDAGVNHGTRWGVRLMQRAFNTLSFDEIAEDGLIGPQTISAVNGYRWPDRLKLAMIFVRAEYFRAIVKSDPTQKRFIGGWFNRLDKLYKEVL